MFAGSLFDRLWPEAAHTFTASWSIPVPIPIRREVVSIPPCPARIDAAAVGQLLEIFDFGAGKGLTTRQAARVKNVSGRRAGSDIGGILRARGGGEKLRYWW